MINIFALLHMLIGLFDKKKRLNNIQHQLKFHQHTIHGTPYLRVVLKSTSLQLLVVVKYQVSYPDYLRRKMITN